MGSDSQVVKQWQQSSSVAVAQPQGPVALAELAPATVGTDLSPCSGDRSGGAGSGGASSGGVGSREPASGEVRPSETLSVSLSRLSQLASGQEAETMAAPFELPDLAILVVEDNLVNQQLILAVLEQWGFCPAVAESGAEALALLRARSLEQQPFEVVLMDVEMPELDGLGTTAEIRAMAIPQPWVIGLSAHAFREDRQKALAAGMNDYLTKPFRMGTLAVALGRGVSRLQPGVMPLLAQDEPRTGGPGTVRQAISALADTVAQEMSCEMSREMSRETACEAGEVSEAGEAGEAGEVSEAGEAAYETVRELPGETGEWAEAFVTERSGEGMGEAIDKTSDAGEISRTLQTLRRHLGNAVLADLVKTFLEETPPQIRQMQMALARQDCGAIARIAHSLKGSCLALGARQLSQNCLALERLSYQKMAGGQADKAMDSGGDGGIDDAIAPAMTQLLGELEQVYDRVAVLLSQGVG